ncbi:MAG TPA: hypothetical protein VD971_11620 [Phycisphaerales bacterium]|nr:hypothetical protein [Phycisphaerales bacterium]
MPSSPTLRRAGWALAAVAGAAILVSGMVFFANQTANPARADLAGRVFTGAAVAMIVGLTLARRD